MSLSVMGQGSEGDPVPLKTVPEGRVGFATEWKPVLVWLYHGDEKGRVSPI